MVVCYGANNGKMTPIIGLPGATKGRADYPDSKNGFNEYIPSSPLMGLGIFSCLLEMPFESLIVFRDKRFGPDGPRIAEIAGRYLNR